MWDTRRRLIIVWMGDVLLLRLKALLDAPPEGEGAPSLAYLEDVLTDGYACALALEAERARVARHIGELAARHGDDAVEKTRELQALSERLTGADSELARLRDTLRALSRRTTALRSAAVLS
jgi:hypothetical protein